MNIVTSNALERRTSCLVALAVAASLAGGGCRRIAAQAGEAAGAVGGSGPRVQRAAAAHAPSNPLVAAFSREQQVLGAFARTNAVRSCWESALLRDPAHPPESVHVQLAVDEAGRARVSVSGANDSVLGTCIHLRGGGVAVGTGPVAATEAVFNLAPGG